MNMNFPNNEISKLSARKYNPINQDDGFNYATEDEDDKYKKKSFVDNIPILRYTVCIM